METQNKIQENLEVVSNKIYGSRTERSKLYMILWERIANWGTVLCWADSEEEAYKKAMILRKKQTKKREILRKKIEEKLNNHLIELGFTGKAYIKYFREII